MLQMDMDVYTVEHTNGLIALAAAKPPLTILKLEGGVEHTVEESSSAVDDSAVQAFATSCPGLKMVHLTGSVITDAALNVLARCCTCLEELNLGACQSISPDGLGSFLRQCLALRVLDLSWLHAFDHAAAWAALSDSRSRIIDLNVRGVKVDDDSVAEIARTFPDLETLELEYNEAVTDKGCYELVALGKHLTWVGLSECPEVTSAVCDENDHALLLDELRQRASTA